MSDHCGTVAGMVMPERSISTEAETFQVSLLPYSCLICPFCCVCLCRCAAEFEVPEGLINYPVYRFSKHKYRNINHMESGYSKFNMMTGLDVAQDGNLRESL
jgi:hypothetical protein